MPPGCWLLARASSAVIRSLALFLLAPPQFSRPAARLWPWGGGRADVRSTVYWPQQHNSLSDLALHSTLRNTCWCKTTTSAIHSSLSLCINLTRYCTSTQMSTVKPAEQQLYFFPETRNLRVWYSVTAGRKRFKVLHYWEENKEELQLTS